MNFFPENNSNICKDIFSSLQNSSSSPQYLKPNTLPGERILKSNIEETTFYFLTQYRFGFLIDNKFKIISIGIIYEIKTIQICKLLIMCKDGKNFLIPFTNNTIAYDWECAILNLINTNNEITSTFAFTYKSLYSVENKLKNIMNQSENILLEYKRLGFENNKYWELIDVNENYEICLSYPTIHILPSKINIDIISESAHFRKNSRFPSLTWRNLNNKSILLRSSQPCVGILNYRSNGDELLIESFLEEIRQETNKDAKMIIFDARSKSAAMANCAKGGGYENITYYQGCQLKFANIGNIHSIRNLFYGVSKFYLSGEIEPDADIQYLETDSINYLEELSLLLRAGRRIARYLYDGISVLVHCSDGWDRTSQICSLAKLILDPYYRTISGFLMLIQRDWIDYGHQFYQRCLINNDPNENSPVFVVFIDCVHQLIRQLPDYFEFNESFLHKIIDHVYSNLYGTFLCNSVRQRHELKLEFKTNCLWDFFIQHFDYFFNFGYLSPLNPQIELLNFQCDSRNLVLWHNLFNTDRLAFEVDTSQKIPPHIIKKNMTSLEKLINDAMTDENSAGINQNNKLDTSVCEFEELIQLDMNPIDPNPTSKYDGKLSEYVIVSAVDFDQTSIKNFLPLDHIKKYKHDGTLPFNIKSNVLMLTEDGLPMKICAIYHKFRTLANIAESKKKLKQCNSESEIENKENQFDRYDSMLKRSTSFSSEKGYDNIKISDLGFVNWIPDHLATRCYRCASKFNLIIRKHHCRRCGQVFCGKCTSKKARVEDQLLFDPVRVCDPCYQLIVSFQNIKIASVIF